MSPPIAFTVNNKGLANMLTKNRHIVCDYCGKFISFDDLMNEKAAHYLLTPDSEVTKEDYESYHHKCMPVARA